MSPPFGVGWEVWIGGAIAIGIALIGGMWKFANWKGGLDQWKKSVDEWKNDVKIILKDLQEAVSVIKEDVASIKAASEKDATKNGMIQRRSPLVPSEKAIEILEDLNIISQVDANVSYIQEEIEKRSRTSIYRDIEDSEERFIEIAPGVIHGLIKKGKIEEKKIDKAMKELEKVFPVVTYYGVLLLIAAYILEKGKEKGFIARPSAIYSQIDMAGLKNRDELLASFDGNVEKAIKSLEMSIRTLEEVDNKKELAENKFLLALMHKYIGRTEEAEKEYREAIRINPNYAEAHNNLGILLGELKRFEEAEKEYREAIRINPNYAEAHNNLGNLLSDLKRFEEAEKEYRESIELKDNLPDKGAMIHYNLGNLFYNLKQFEEAEKEYREAIRINPNYVDAHNNLGSLLYDLKRFKEAEEEYREAIRIKPDDADAPHNNLGILLSVLKQFKEAEEEYREAIKINPDYAEAHNNLGVLYSETKRSEEAKRELGIAKRLFGEQGREEDVKEAEELLQSL
ncbi:MAG: tetratricopeptide repeat protein [Methanophagales archaeon]|nr:tetratricopeptide repeat protein [Methanophagales archaeon]